MAGEIQLQYTTGHTLYALIRNSVGQIWNTSTLAFEAYVTANLANYKVALTEQGSASGFYTGTFPSQISVGWYGIVVKSFNTTPAESDVTVGAGDYTKPTVANQVDANIKYVNSVLVRGTGITGDEWGPA